MLTVASGSIYLLFDALCYVLPLNKWTDKSIAEQISPFLFIDSKHCFEQQLTKCLVIRFKFNSVSLSLSLFRWLRLSHSQPFSLIHSVSRPTSFTHSFSYFNLSLSFTRHLFHCLWLCLSHGLVMFRIFQCNVCVCNEKSTSIPPQLFNSNVIVLYNFLVLISKPKSTRTRYVYAFIFLFIYWDVHFIFILFFIRCFIPFHSHHIGDDNNIYI